MITAPSTTIATYWRANPDCTSLATRPTQAVNSPVPLTRPSMMRTSITFHNIDTDSLLIGRTNAASYASSTLYFSSSNFGGCHSGCRLNQIQARTMPRIAMTDDTIVSMTSLPAGPAS